MRARGDYQRTQKNNRDICNLALCGILKNKVKVFFVTNGAAGFS